MSNYIPYIILVGVMAIFFIICCIFFSGSKTEKKHRAEEKKEARALAQKRAEEKAAWAQIEALHDEREAERKSARSQTAPVPKISTVTVRERKENPKETAFVTTKGEAVRQNGRIVYQSQQKTDDALDQTRVLSRDEIIEAMDKVDKEEAAAFKAEAEEAKKRRAKEQQQVTDQTEKERRQAEREFQRQQELQRKEREAQAKKRAKAPVKGAVAADDVEPSLAEMAAVVSRDLAEKDGTLQQGEKKTGESLSQETQIMNPVAAAGVASVAGAAGDETQIMAPVKAKSYEHKPKDAQSDETRRMEPVHVDAATKPQKIESKPKSHETAVSPWGNDLSKDKKEKRASIWNEPDDLIQSPVVKACVHHFLGQYGIATESFKKNVEDITAAAFRTLNADTDSEREKAVEPLLVQEALQNVQKSYVANPQDYIAAMTIRAFDDIVNCPPVSTRHLVAIDALKVMPYLKEVHYKILAILLLFLYSRNSHNVDTESFNQYIGKYILPFLDRFPTERAYYQQLDYLHCTAMEQKETRFSEILSESYPLLFRYRGFTEEELRKALKGQRIPNQYIVKSFNSPLSKLALVDDSMAPRFFRIVGIQDRAMQNRLLRLAKKHPVNFAGEEALDIMEDISPILADMGDIWDSTMLRISTLSLLGLYLAQGYVKEKIGEEFDLSRWFE